MLSEVETETKDSLEYQYYRVKRQCQNSLWTHVKKGMGYGFVPDEIKDMTDWVQSKWDPCKPKRKNILVQVSRDSYKSTSITQSFPSWALSKNANLSMLIVSKISDNATNFLRVQKKRFEEDEFISIFGRWRTPFTWGEDRITIAARTNWRKEPSIMAAGQGTELTSMHFDVIILDDLTTKRDMYSPAEREQTARMLKSAYDLADKRKCLVMLVGTCWHQEDELEKIKKANPQKIRDGLDPYEIYYRPAEIWKNGEWKILWAFFTRKILDQTRADKADIMDYSANYRLLPLPPESQIFSKFSYFNCQDEKLKVILDHIVIFIDPSLKETKKSDYSAIVVCGKRNDGRILVLDADIKRRKPSDTIAAMCSIYLKWNQLEVGLDMFMETVLFQEYLKDEAINQALLKDIYLPLDGYPQIKNKIMRITGIEKYVTSSQILFREDWKEQLNGYDLLMSQLQNFPIDNHDDGPDALEGCVSVITDSTGLDVDFLEM